LAKSSGTREARDSSPYDDDLSVQDSLLRGHIEPSAYLNRPGGAVKPKSAPLAAVKQPAFAPQTQAKCGASARPRPPTPSGLRRDLAVV
jgi:hypothetical protein